MTVMKQGMQVEVELHVPIQKLWEALKKMNILASKIAPDLTHQILEGDGGVGSVNLMEFGDGRYEKEQVDIIDDRTHTLVATVLSGKLDVQYNEYKKTVALSPARNGAATIACWRAECAPVEGSALPGLAVDNALSLFKALESYLNSTKNPYA